MITAVMSPGAITTGLVLLALCGLALAFWGMSGERDPGPLFAEMPAAPGRCSCGAPHALKPFPGDEPVQAAPAAEPEPEPEPAPAEQAEDTAWTRHHVVDVWERLKAEAAS